MLQPEQRIDALVKDLAWKLSKPDDLMLDAFAGTILHQQLAFSKQT